MANAAAQAFIAFLRCEAQQAEDRAKSLRTTAAAIEANNLEGMYLARCNCTAMQFLAMIESFDLTTFDSHTLTFGHVRIARRKKRKREPSSPSKGKTQSAYTMFVQENYESTRKNHPDLPSREIISILARQWGNTSEVEKQAWKYRADNAPNAPSTSIPGIAELEEHASDDDEENEEEEEEEEEEDPEEDENEADGGGKRQSSSSKNNAGNVLV